MHIITLFHLIRMLAIMGGAAVLGTIGWNVFGMPGGVIGVPLGFLLGAIIGQMPLIVGLKLISRRFDRMTDDQLVAELHDPACLTPNLHLLELNRRGYNIRCELAFVQSLLASEEMRQRTAGWAALISVFPDLVGRVSGYHPTASTAECQEMCKPLTDATEQ